MLFLIVDDLSLINFLDLFGSLEVVKVCKAACDGKVSGWLDYQSVAFNGNI